jgi:hypothetical protein
MGKILISPKQMAYVMELGADVGDVAVGDVTSMLSSHGPQGPSVQTKTNRQVESKAS